MNTPVLFNVSFQQYTTNQNSVIAQCAAIIFFNSGESIVYLNGSLPILPGVAFNVSGEQYEKDTTIYSFIFQGTAGQANSCTIIRKYYNKYPEETEAINDKSLSLFNI